MRGFCCFHMMWWLKWRIEKKNKNKKKKGICGLRAANQIRIHKIPKLGDLPSLQIHLMLKSPFPFCKRWSGLPYCVKQCSGEAGRAEVVRKDCSNKLWETVREELILQKEHEWNELVVQAYYLKSLTKVKNNSVL